jgi:hypothetical protein
MGPTEVMVRLGISVLGRLTTRNRFSTRGTSRRTLLQSVAVAGTATSPPVQSQVRAYMDPPDDVVRDAARRLARVQGTVSVDPAVVLPGQECSITWRVIFPNGVQAGIYLNNQRVAASGKWTRKIFTETTFSLQARSLGVTRGLASKTVRVNADNCLIVSIPEKDLTELIVTAVRNEVGDGLPVDLEVTSAVVRLDSPPDVQIGPAGTRVKVSFDAQINNVPDAKIYASGDLIFSAERGSPVVTVRNFDVDTDFDDIWAALSAGTAKLFEEILDALIESRIKNRIVEGAQQAMSEAVAPMSSLDLVLMVLATATDRVDATFCPGEP